MRKIKKILSAATAAAVLTTSVVATSANAQFYGPDGPSTELVFDENGMYQVAIYLDGGGEPGNAFCRFDDLSDLSTIDSVAFTFRVPEAWQDTADGQFGGCIGTNFATPTWQYVSDVVREEQQRQRDEGIPEDEIDIDPVALGLDPTEYENYTKYFWDQTMFWTLTDPVIEDLGNFTYRLKTDVANPIVDGVCSAEDLAFVNVFMQGWGADDWEATMLEVVRTTLYDSRDNVILDLDNFCNPIVELPVSDSTAIHAFYYRDDETGYSYNNYLTDVYISGLVEEAGEPLNLGIDVSKLGGVAYTFQVLEEGRDKFLGVIGGAVGASMHTTNMEWPEDWPYAPEDYPIYDKYNWPGTLFFGVTDENAPYPNWPIAPNGEVDESLPKHLNFFHADEYLNDPDHGTFIETLGDYTYRVKGTFPNPVVDGACAVNQLVDVKMYLQLWDNDQIGDNEFISRWDNYHEYVKITRVVLFDINNNPMIAIDGNGNVVATTTADAKDPVMPGTSSGSSSGSGNPPAGFTPPKPDVTEPDTTEPGTNDPATSEPDEDTTVFEPAIDEEELAELDEETKDIVQNVVVEDNNDAFEEGTVMNIGDVEKTEESFSFDITFTKDGKEVQPKSVVTVKIPVPEYLQNVTLYLYHYDDNGKPTAVKFEIKDGVMIFEATSFSKYEMSTVWIAEAFATDDTSEPAPGDTTTNPGNNPSTGIGYAFVPAILAAGAVVISKKRK